MMVPIVVGLYQLQIKWERDHKKVSRQS
jgi:hypothetical protein